MKNLGKKLISILLSALMVVTMLPFSAFTVFADTVSNHIVGAYLTRNATDGVTTTAGSVTWDNTNGAYFNGSSALQLVGTPFNSVTGSSGFTITFETKTTSNSSGKVFMFKNAASSPTDYFGFFGIVDGSNYQNNAVIYKVDGYNQAGLWTWDFYNESYFAEHATNIIESTTNNKYRFTISMDANGYMYYYRDGVLLGKLRNDYHTQGVGSGIKPALIKNAFIKFTNYMIGEGLTGYVKNMYLFDTCLTDAQAQSEISGCTGGTIAQLSTAISNYETKMNTTRSGAVYTNMGQAYQAYMMAERAYDAYQYGKDTSINLSLYIDPLVRATDNMTAWSAWNTFVYGGLVNNQNYTGSWNGNDTSYNSKLAQMNHNVLYVGTEQCPNPGTDTKVGYSVASTYSSDDSRVRVEMYYNTNVLLYTGGTDYPYFAVACRGFRNSGGKDRYMNAVYPSGGTKTGTNQNDTAHPAFEIYNSIGEANNTTNLKDKNNANATGTYFSQWSGHDATRLCIGYIGGRTDSYFSGQRYNDNGNYSNEVNSQRYYAASCLYYTTPSSSLDTWYILWGAATAGTKGANGYSSDFGSATASVPTYVVNYKSVTDGLSNNLSKFSDITNYKYGGALEVLTGYQIAAGLDLSSNRFASDVAAETAALKTQIDTAVAKMGASSTTDVSGYDTLRSYLSDGLGTKTIGSLGTYTVHQVIPEASLNADTVTNYADFETAYNNAKNHMAGVLSTGYTGVGSLATTLYSTFNSLDEKGAEAPSITADCYLEPNGTVTVTNNDPSALDVKYTIAYDGGAAGAAQTAPGIASGATTSVNVFGGSTAHSTATVTAWVVKNGKNSSTVSATYTLLAAPSFSIADNGVIEKNGTVTLTNTNAVGTVQYSLDGISFTNGTSISPFNDNTASVKTIYAKVVYNTLESAVSSINVLRKASFSVYTNNTKGNKFYDSNTIINIEDTSNYSDDIYFTLVADGVAVGTVHTYDKTNKINLTQSNTVSNAIKNAKVVEIVAYAAPHGALIGSNGTITASATLISTSAQSTSLVYQESFDDASVAGTTFTSSKGNGVLGSGSTGVAVIDKWDSNNGTGADVNGNVNGIRKKVLKLSQAGNHASENKVILNTNPLASTVNAAFAKNQGVTISFWRALSRNDVTVWMPGVAFIGEDAEGGNQYEYFEINAAGTLSFNNGNVGDNGLPFLDIILRNNDATTHATGTTNTAWVNFAVTIDPNSGIKYYVNGKEYLTCIDYAYGADENGLISQVVKSQNYDAAGLNANGVQRLDYENNGAMATALLELITSGKVKFEIGGGDPYNTNYCDTYIDDVRVYTEVKTQVDINNMYADEFTDAYKEGTTTKFSTSHDPTNVTVYTLTDSIATDNGTKASGSQVGIEFIEYYNVPSSKYTVEYYSFGTDMTLYHSTDNVNWTVLGDDRGRCGYQNQKLYGGVYTTVLADQLAWCATNAANAYYYDEEAGAYKTHQTGAGYLQWAPHVMYNLTLDKWCYYGSTSDWNSSKSCIFMGTSTDIEGPYADIETIFQSGDGYWVANDQTPANAIDSCVYYGHDANGRIDKSQLYCSYGSWGPGYVLTLNADGSYSKTWGDSGYAGTQIFATYDDGGGWSGEGGYVVYENGYYYFYITLGHNGGNYQQRVFRSTSPTGGFVAINGNDALSTATVKAPHGQPIITPYYLPVNKYAYTSLGHNSVYKAINNNNEVVTISAAHTRPFATSAYSGGTAAMVDGGLATRQSALEGNVAIHNMVAYTENGWALGLPLTYNGDDTVNVGASVSAYDFEGTYAANNLLTAVEYNYARPTTYSIYATSKTGGYFVSNGEVKYYFTSTNEGGKIYLTIKNSSGTTVGEGVVAKQGSTFEFAYLISSTAATTWGYKTGDNASVAEIQDELDEINENKTITGIAYYSGIEATGGYSNVLSCTTSSVWASSSKDMMYEYANIALPTSSVLVYDGENRPSIPVVFSHQANGNHSQYFKALWTTTSNLAVNQNWQGYVDIASGSDKIWPGNAETLDSFSYSSSITKNSGTQGETETSGKVRYWWNKLEYTGSVNTDSYYETITSPVFRLAGHCDALFANEQEENLNSPAATIKIVNYEPIYSILAGKTKFPGTDLVFNEELYNDIKANKYTATSTMAFYRAMEFVMAADVENFDYASDFNAAQTEYVKNMQLALEAFNAVNLERRGDLTYFYAEYDKANTFLKSLDGKAAQYTAASVQALINALEAEGTTVDVSDIVASDSEDRADYGQDVQTEADAFADDIKDAFNNLKTAKDIGTDITEETDTAFIAATAKLNNADPDAYEISSGSIETAIRTVNDIAGAETAKSYDGATINVLNNSISDETMQSLITTVESALTVSTKKYAVSKDAEGSQDFTIGIRNGKLEDGKAYYGTTVVATSNDADTTWYIDIYTNSMHKKTAYAGYGKTYTGKVLGTTTIKAVKKGAGESRVKILRQYGTAAVTDRSPIQTVEYVTTGASYTLPTAPAISFYTFDGYYTTSGTKLGASVTVSEDTEIYARYNADPEADCAINATGGSAAYSETVKYNDRVSLTGAANTYGWVEAIDETHYRPFYIGKDVEFLATESTELKAVSSFDGFNFSLPAVNLRKSGVMKDGTKTTFNAQIVANGYNVKEYGILIGAKSGKDKAGNTVAEENRITPAAEQVIIENSGQQDGWAIYRAKSTRLVGANQFSISVHGLPSNYIYRGYLIYEDSKGALHNVYSEAM